MTNACFVFAFFESETKGEHDHCQVAINQCAFLVFRLKQKVVELQTFKQQCGDLEQRVTTFIQEKEQFEKEVRLFFLMLLNNRGDCCVCFRFLQVYL